MKKVILSNNSSKEVETNNCELHLYYAFKLADGREGLIFCDNHHVFCAGFAYRLTQGNIYKVNSHLTVLLKELLDEGGEAFQFDTERELFSWLSINV